MSGYDLLLNNIRQSVTIEDSEIRLIQDSFRVKKLAKKEILLYKGEISTHMRFIAKGCLRSYYPGENAQEHILQFGIENWWINDLYSYLSQTPARYFVQAIEPSEVLQIHRDSLEKLFKEVPAMERFFRIKIQNAYVALGERTIHTMSQTAEERYLAFRTRYREIEQRVPQYMVAAYLGITPEFLSSIRKKFTSQQLS
jgi:CRP-like cAMP-binding protein